MINPAIARPRPCNSGFLSILERARCPQMIPGTPDSSPQQKRPSKLRTSDQIASGSVGGPGTEVPTVGDAITGTPGPVAPASWDCVLVGPPGVTPGTVDSGAQPAAPSYHA